MKKQKKQNQGREQLKNISGRTKEVGITITRCKHAGVNRYWDNLRLRLGSVCGLDRDDCVRCRKRTGEKNEK